MYKRKNVYTLTAGDEAIFAKAATDARFFGDFYLGGFIMFPWQLRMHHASQWEHTIIGGYGCGKTVAVAHSAVIHATMTPHFKFMNTASVAEQSKQMFSSIISNWEETRWWERFVFKINERPYPKITIKYIIPSRAGSGEHKPRKSRTVTQTLEFMSAQDQGKKILSWEGDWMCIDEAGLLTDEQLAEAIRNLGSRLRGTIHKRARMGRLTLLSNSWDNQVMWNRFDKHELAPNAYLSETVKTKQNTAITPAQLEAIRSRLDDPDEEERWLEGARPKPRGKEFSGAAIEACTDDTLDELMESLLKDDRWASQTNMQKHETAGVVEWQLPYDVSRQYLIVGDPGQGYAPKRNAPVVMVWDVTDFVELDKMSDQVFGLRCDVCHTPYAPPAEGVLHMVCSICKQPLRITIPPKHNKTLRGRGTFRGKAILRAFWWGDGQGQFRNFGDKFLHWKHTYRCLDATFDSTGTQTNIHEIFSLLEEEMIYGTSLSGKNKFTGLVTLKLLLERAKLAFPRGIRGIPYQLGTYKIPDKGIAQDLVSAMTIMALWLRRYYYYEPTSDNEMPGTDLEAKVDNRRHKDRPQARHKPRHRTGRNRQTLPPPLSH